MKANQRAVALLFIMSRQASLVGEVVFMDGHKGKKEVVLAAGMATRPQYGGGGGAAPVVEAVADKGPPKDEDEDMDFGIFY